jgi:hypothetical protein
MQGAPTARHGPRLSVDRERPRHSGSSSEKARDSPDVIDLHFFRDLRALLSYLHDALSICAMIGPAAYRC